MIFKDLNKLQEIIQKEKDNWKKIIWTNGCFDIMHPGHMKTFNVCRKMADIIVVWMNWDASPYWKTKPWRPVNNEGFRSTMLDNLKNVDYIYIFDDNTPVEPVEVLKPDFILKWWDYIQESIKDYAVEKEGIIDLTKAYEYIIESWVEKFEKEKWFMPEAVKSVENNWKVIIVPIVAWCSTTNIIDELQPKSFINLVEFYKYNSNKYSESLESYINWFYNKLNIEYNRNFIKETIKQFNIYIVDFWQNIWVEFNKRRPALVISWKKFSSKWDNLIVIPITSYYNTHWKAKKVYKTDIVVEKSNNNWLINKSIIRCWSIRDVSKKRLNKLVWRLEKEYYIDTIDIVKDIFNIK